MSVICSFPERTYKVFTFNIIAPCFLVRPAVRSRIHAIHFLYFGFICETCNNLFYMRKPSTWATTKMDYWSTNAFPCIIY